MHEIIHLKSNLSYVCTSLQYRICALQWFMQFKHDLWVLKKTEKNLASTFLKPRTMCIGPC